MNVLHELNNLQIDTNKKSRYHNYTMRQLWNLYNAILAGGAAGNEHEVLDEIRQREGW